MVLVGANQGLGLDEPILRDASLSLQVFVSYKPSVVPITALAVRYQSFDSGSNSLVGILDGS